MRQVKFAAAMLLLLVLGCSPSVPPSGLPPDVRAKDSGLELLEPKVDIVFVIDNSGSMENHQKNLAANVDNFINNFFNTIQIDFHIGILTTDDDSTATTNCCGILVGNPTVIDRSTPDFRNVLAKRMLVGTSGSATEKMFDPVFKAFSLQNLNGPNQGFLRQDAFLSIVFITDAEDQSSVVKLPQDLENFLVQLKGRADRILSYGVIVPSGVTNCPRDDGTEPHRTEQFLSMSPTAGKNEFSLCDPHFGDRMAEIGRDLANRVGNSLLLKRVPVVETIRLRYGSQVIPPNAKAGWSYDPEDNSIHIGPEMVWSAQPAGTKMNIDYDFTSFHNKPKP